MSVFTPRLRDTDLAPSPLTVDHSVLLGRWRNTETRWQWVREIEIAAGPRVRIRGGSDAPSDWGDAPIDAVYTTAPDSNEVGGFSASFELDGMTSLVQATLNQGLLVVVAFNDAQDGGRSRVTREFFAREGGTR